LTDSIRRFSSRVDDYIKYRPTYPPAVVRLLMDECGLTTDSFVADVGSGTGILSELLLRYGSRVFGIEPNREMRAAAERLLQNYTHFASVDATAETTTLADRSVDFVTAGQAFHWFDAERAFAELARVLRPGGRVGILWNARDRSVDWVDRVWAIMDAVERHAPWRDHENGRDAALDRRAGFGPLHTATFRQEHALTPEGVVDRIRGVSHVAALDPAEQAVVLDDVWRELAEHPDTRGRNELHVPYRVDCYWTELFTGTPGSESRIARSTGRPPP